MNKELKNGIVLSIIIVLIIIIVYLTTAVFMTGEIGNKSKQNTTTTSTASDESYNNMIIASRSFNQSDSEYMVLFFSAKDSSDSLSSIIKNYDSAKKEPKLYKVNIDEKINEYIKHNDKNISASNSTELGIKSLTLITIKDGIITSYIDQESQILDILK